MAPIGRPTKFSGAVGAKIVRARSDGRLQRDAAAAGGIPYRTLRKWLLAGEQGREPYASFAAAFRAAERSFRKRATADARAEMAAAVA